MIRFIYGDDLHRHPTLAQSMFCDRAAQFHRRLGWDVQVDALGQEKDAYDALNPLYVIWQNLEGHHGGSMRFLPTTGRTMVQEHFSNLTDITRLQSPLIWECTRFCLAPKAEGQIAAALMLAGGALMQNFGLHHFVGVFDGRMERIYRRIGSSPEVLGTHGQGRAKIAIGLWHFDRAVQAQIAQASGISIGQMQRWFDQDFPADKANSL